MKISTLFALALTATFAAPLAQATELVDARVDESRGVIEVDVRYGGGCKEHKFKLELGGCLESMPVQCGATIKDLTKDDFCEALVGKTVSFSLASLGLNDSYFSGGTLTISGSRGSKKVQLPR